LIGIEIKNSILLVDFTNQLRAKGTPLKEAIEQAGEIRFLPVVLTTFIAVGALLPLAVQKSGLYSPLAVVIIGGLISSLLLSRLVTAAAVRLLKLGRQGGVDLAHKFFCRAPVDTAVGDGNAGAKFFFRLGERLVSRLQVALEHCA